MNVFSIRSLIFACCLVVLLGTSTLNMKLFRGETVTTTLDLLVWTELVGLLLPSEEAHTSISVSQ